MQRVCVTACLFVALQGCGGSGSGPQTSRAASPAVARQCLLTAQLRVVGGPRSAGDATAPNVELIATGRQAYAFLAFYDLSPRATKYARMIRSNAQRFHGTVERHGKLTILWVHGSKTPEGHRIRNCGLEK